MIQNFSRFLLFFTLISSSIFAEEKAAPDLNACFEKVFEKHSQSLSYLKESNPKLLIMFSGTPGMGKTMVAKKLQDNFHAIRISSDEIRLILKELGFSRDLADQYVAWCLQKLADSSPNHLIILDRSVDRSYDVYANFAKEHTYDSFLIRMQLEKETIKERIRSRGIDVEPLLHHMEQFWKDYEVFGKSHQASYLFDSSSNFENSVKSLTEQIKEQLSPKKTQ